MNIYTVFRYIVLAVLLLVFGISAAFRRRVRKNGGVIKHQEEGWPILILRMGFALPLLIVLLLNIFYPRILDWSKIELPFYIRIIGLVIIILCVPLLWWVFSSIGNFISEPVLTKENHQFVPSGPYRIVRHPFYAGSLLLLISIGLIFGDWIILGYGIAGIIAFRLLVIPAEEKQLLDAFGEEYECYQSRTGALLPWIR